MLGQRFAPLPGDDPTRRPQNTPGGPISPVQEAIRTLSLRLPRVQYAGSPVPRALLTNPGMPGLPTPSPTPNAQGENPIMEALLRIIRGGFGGSQDIVPNAAPPPPRIEYIADPDRPLGEFEPAPQAPARETPARVESDDRLRNHPASRKYYQDDEPYAGGFRGYQGGGGKASPF